MTLPEVLLQEQHVSRAAARIGRSQRAMSNAHGRLRELFGDPPLIRTPLEMRLTPKAWAPRPSLKAALERLRIVLARLSNGTRTT